MQLWMCKASTIEGGYYNIEKKFLVVSHAQLLPMDCLKDEALQDLELHGGVILMAIEDFYTHLVDFFKCVDYWMVRCHCSPMPPHCCLKMLACLDMSF